MGFYIRCSGFLGSGFVKPGQDGLEFQTLHILVSLRSIQIPNPGVPVIKFHRTVRTDGCQLLAHLSHAVMLLQSLSGPGRLKLLQMGIGVLYGLVPGDDTGCCFLPDGRHARYIVRGIPHKGLHINEFLRRHLILPQHILREIVLNLSHAPAGSGDPYLNVFISQLQKIPVP